jgi:hypothetical protein
MHDRWISKYAEPVVGALSAMKRHLEARVHFRRLFRLHPGPAGPRLAGDHQVPTAQYYLTHQSSWSRAPSPCPPPTARCRRWKVLEIDPPNRLTMSFPAGTRRSRPGTSRDGLVSAQGGPRS